MPSPITRVARARIDPSKRDELLAAYATYANAISDDEDVLAWEFCTGADDENVIWIIATFADTEAHARHMAAPATAAVLPMIQSAMVEPPHMTALLPHYSVRAGRPG
jgi:quinol monooxygenase YgiN